MNVTESVTAAAPRASAGSLKHAMGRVGGVLILALIAILFAGLDAAFIFSGPLLPYSKPTVTVFLVAGAVLMAVMGLLSRFRCLYTGFQDEAVVILAALVGGVATAADGQVDDSVYATALAAVAVSTLITGCFFFSLGTLRLGRLIRYVPFSVTAGFMITIGGLLMSGGFELAESRSVGAVADAAMNGVSWPLKGASALLVALLITLSSRWLGRIVALPFSFLLAIAVFYTLSALTDTSVHDLSQTQWLMPTLETGDGDNGWTILLGAEIDWQVVAAQWRSFISVAVISALSLLLAVTALELSTRQRVDVDRELRAAGAANLGAGALGGATGYHEDAVTTMLHQNMAGDKGTVLFAALLCGAVALFDVGWFSYVPLPVLGGVLMWLGWQLWREWLFYNGSYLHRTDWIAVAAIVLVTLFIGFIAGVLLGIGVGIALFLVDYSQVRTVRYVVNGREIRSNVDRSAFAEQILYDHGQRIHVIKLQGYLFFARSHQVIMQLEPVFDALSDDETHFSVIDFHGVAGIDSTATMAFVRLKQMASDAGVELVFTGLGIEARVDLARIELADGSIKYFDTLDQGLAYCEDALLSSHQGDYDERASASVIFSEILSLSGGLNDGDGYLQQLKISAGEYLIEMGAPADDIYLVEKGSLSVRIESIEHKPIMLRGLEPGSVFGEMALYLGGTRSASVVAETDAIVQKLDNDSLRRMETENPAAAMAVHKLMARLMATKLRQTNTWLGHLR